MYYRAAILLCVCLLARLCASSTSQDHIFLDASRTITLAISAPIGALNPQGYGSNAMFAQNLVYEGLTALDKQGNIIPSLATSWRISDNGKAYTFFLRENTRFSNGEIFDANAVIKNFTSVLQNKQSHAWTGLIHTLDTIKKLDNHTIIITLRYPYALTLHELAFVRPFRFLAPSSFPNDLNLKATNPTPIGTGPYALVSTTPSAATFRKNPYFIDKSTGKTPYFDTLITKIIFDPSAKLAALKTGQIDGIYGQDFITLDMLQAFRHNHAFSTYISPLPIFTIALALNPHRTPLESPQTRKAFLRMLNSTDMISSVYGPLASRATSFYAPNTTLLHNLAHTPFYEDTPPTCTLIQDSPPKAPLELLFISNNPPQRMLAQIIQAQAKTCGITVNITGVEPSGYKNRLINNAFDLAFTETWGAPYEPLSHLYAMRIKGHIEHELLQNLPTQKAFNTYIQHAVLTHDANSLRNNLSHAISLLAQAYILFPIAYKHNVAIMKSTIHGITMGAQSIELPVEQWYK